jgi:hypothetical protein
MGIYITYNTKGGFENMKCPKCNSENVKGYARIIDRAFIDLKTKKIEHEFGFVEIDFEDMDEFHCGDCEYEWEGELEWKN